MIMGGSFKEMSHPNIRQPEKFQPHHLFPCQKQNQMEAQRSVLGREHAMFAVGTHGCGGDPFL